MLSLPYITPRDDLWTTSSFRPNLPSADAANNPHRQHPHSSHHAHQQQQQQQQISGHAHADHAASPTPHSHVHHPFRLASSSSYGNSLNNTTARSGGSSSLSSQLDILAADERLIEQRKLNVRRFGAGWLRPPGVAKTFQARLDEEQERREQAEIARREAQMAELAAASAAEAAARNTNANAGADANVNVDEAGEVVMQEQVEPGMEERDLDADVPDADAMVSDEDDDDDEEEEDEDEEEDTEEEQEGNVTVEPSRFNEESMLEGSLVGGDGFSPARAERYVDAEDAELDGRAQDMRDLGVERDLDEEIPEAGSYEHTDTEEEDSDSSDDNDDDEDDHEPRSEADENDDIQQHLTSSARVDERHIDLSVLDETVEEMMDSSFVSYTRPSNNTNNQNNSNIHQHTSNASITTNNHNARRTGAARRSVGGGRQQRGRWSGGSDVVMTGSEAEAEPSPVSAHSVMARLRAARRNG